MILFKFNRIKHFVIALTGLLLIISCERDNTSTGPDQTVLPSITGAFIINEGNFLQGNASIDFYSADSGKIFHNLFNIANGNAPGDVAYSMVIDDTLGYIVVNNSHKIEVISILDAERIATIRLPNGASPRNLVLDGNGNGYVSALYKNLIYQLNMDSYTVQDSIPVGANPEEIALHGGKLFVANSGFGSGNTISVIDLSTKTVTEIITVGDGPQWIRDSGGMLQVLCIGAYGDFSDPNDDTPGGIWLIDPATNSVVDSLVLAAGIHPSDLAISASGKGYFSNGSGIVEYNPATMQVVNANLISGFFYHVSVNPANGRLFVLDAKDFISPGELIIFDENGAELERHSTGIIPGDVQFIYLTN